MTLNVPQAERDFGCRCGAMGMRRQHDPNLYRDCAFTDLAALVRELAVALRDEATARGGRGEPIALAKAREAGLLPAREKEKP